MTTTTDASPSGGADMGTTSNTNEANPTSHTSDAPNDNDAANSDGAHLDTAALEQLSHPRLFAIQSLLDELPPYNIDTTVELPQIIVVGDPLVISALSRIVLADRAASFVTEIILQPAKKWETRIATWYPDDEAYSEQCKWADIEHQQPLGNDFTEIIQKAHDSISECFKGDERFSDKVLRIEIQGPDLQPLKLVDLPHLSACPQDSKPTKNRTITNNVVESYMRKRNSIILVTARAYDLTEVRTALQKARQLDPDGERTIGIIGGPDDADNEDSLCCIRVIKDEDPEYHLRLGWHVLRGQESYDSDISDFDNRDEAETAFFKELPWNFVLETDTGINNLRKKLRSLMYNNMRRDIPDLVNQIKIKLAERQDQLKLCGAERSNMKEMRSFLLRIASDFQRLTRDAISGNYADAFFGELDKPTNRLRAELGALHHAFSHVMVTKSRQYSFGLSTDVYTDPKSKEERIQADTLAETFGKYPYNRESPPVKSRQEVYTRLESLAAVDESKGLPGSWNSDLAIQLFQELSKPWTAIAKHHVAHVVSVVRKFVGNLFLYLIGGESACQELSDFVMRKVDDFFGRREAVLADKIDELLEPYIEGYAIPSNGWFRRYLVECKVRREAKQIKPTALIFSSNKDHNVDIPTQEVGPTDATELGPFGMRGTLNMAEAYYYSCRYGFTDNITNLAIERCLVRRLPEILAPCDIGDLDDKELGQYAAETATQLAKRKQLGLEISMLQEGLEKCKKWRPLEGSSPKRQSAAVDGTSVIGPEKQLQSSKTPANSDVKATPASTIPSAGAAHTTIQPSANTSKPAMSANATGNANTAGLKTTPNNTVSTTVKTSTTTSPNQNASNTTRNNAAPSKGSSVPTAPGSKLLPTSNVLPAASCGLFSSPTPAESPVPSATSAESLFSTTSNSTFQPGGLFGTKTSQASNAVPFGSKSTPDLVGPKTSNTNSSLFGNHSTNGSTSVSTVNNGIPEISNSGPQRKIADVGMRTKPRSGFHYADEPRSGFYYPDEK